MTPTYKIQHEILKAMDCPLSLQELVDITDRPRETLRLHLNAMREDGRIIARIEDGSVTYRKASRKKTRSTSRQPSSPTPTAPSSDPSTASTRPASIRHTTRGRAGHARTGLTNDLRKVLAAADRPLDYSELRVRLPQYTGNQIATICSNRTKSGEFVAIPPTGRGRKYALTNSSAHLHAAERQSSQSLADLRDHEAWLRTTAERLKNRANAVNRIIRTMTATKA